MISRDRAPAALLALILLAAFGLRVWSLGHGLPYSYNLDERAHFVPHAVAMTTGDLNPGYFINPPFLTYILAGWLSVIHLGGVEQWFADDAGAVFLAGRWIAVFMGVGTVAATYFAGKAWFGRRVGLIAAALMAVAFLPVFYSRLALNDGPGMLPCALALWASPVVFKTGSTRALLAGGAAVGLAASFKYSDGAVVIVLVAAAFLSPLSFKAALKGLVYAGLIAIASVIVTNPYLFADWGTFINDLDRQRKFADGPPLLGQPERNGWVYYVKSSTWALGWLPGILALGGGIALLARRRWKEAIILGGLVFLYWLYMGSQSRFYARWMLPLYPTLVVLAAYGLAQIKQRVVLAGVTAIVVAITVFPTIRNAIVMGREDTRTQTRDWLVANVPQGTKVAFEPISPSEWYGSTPGGGAKAHPTQQWTRFKRDPAIILELAEEHSGSRRPANFQNYARTLTPVLLDIYRRLGVCVIVTGSTQYGRAMSEPTRAPAAIKYYAALKRQADVIYKTDPTDGDLPRYQVDKSFNYIDSEYKRPGPEMIVYRLRDCG